MSQTPPAEPVVAESPSFDEQMSQWRKDKLRQTARSGPRYNDPESSPLVWCDQVFQRELTPSGIVDCERALRVGSTQNGLDVLLIAAHANTGEIAAASGATITLVTLQADEMDGTYEAVGPSQCVTAPADGIQADPDALFCRIAIGNFRKPWLKIRLSFSGTITGGKLDAALGYVAR